MKVVLSEESKLEFDNGLIVLGHGDSDCCAYNYLDFEQFNVGDEFKTMTARQFLKHIKIKNDGFIVKDKNGIPKWVQARSEQNGYYSNITKLMIEYNGEVIQSYELNGDLT